MKRRDFIKASAMSATALSLPSFAFAKNSVQVYWNGTILTMDKNNSLAEAIVIQDGKIIAVGKKEDVLKKAGKDPMIFDLQGKCLMPSFIDGHGHFPLNGENALYRVDLIYPPHGKVAKVQDALDLLSKKASTTKKGEWVVAQNFFAPGIAEKRNLTLEEMDKAVPNNPLYIQGATGHNALANSLALKLANIDKNIPNPTNGIVGKDEKGELNGLLEGQGAFKLVQDLIPGYTDAQIADAIKHDTYFYASHGVTLANVGGYINANAQHLKACLKASSDNSLKVRLAFWPNMGDEATMNMMGDKRSGQALDSKNLVFAGALKNFADGSPQAMTANLSQPYTSQAHGKGPDYKGFPAYASKEEFHNLITKYHKDGWQLAIHTNGDQAIEEVLEGYIKALEIEPKMPSPHIFVHAQFARADQLERMAKYGFIPTFYVCTTSYVGENLTPIYGKERAENTNPLKTALDKGLTFANHNDTPIIPLGALMSVYSAVTRLTEKGNVLGEKQKIDLMSALRSVTIDGAKMYNVDKLIGSLEPGKEADFVILDQVPTKVEPTKIKDIQVLETYVQGQNIYKKSV